MAESSGGSLLIVDDEVEIREIIELSASSLGMRVLQAADGVHAMEVLQSQHVDVVVSDLMMPRMTGITLLNTMRSAGFSQPFIFVTAFPSQDSTLQALRLGAFDYVEKPFDPDELELQLKEAMRVSLEVQKLGEREAGTAPMAGVDEDKASSEIQRLKTLRFAPNPAGEGENVASTRHRLHELFVIETTPQLLFCEGAIKGLSQFDQRAFELGYLFRVAQAVASAAEAIGEQGIAELASAAARFYTVLRVKPRAVNDEVIVLAQRANDCLRMVVSEAGAGSPALKDDALDVSRELLSAARDVEDGRSLIAS